MPRVGSADKLKQLMIGYGLLLLPIICLLPLVDGYPFPPQPGAYSDMVVTHDPNAYFLQQELLKRREVPLWSPAILSGYPFAANPLSGLMYPPGWLALVFPLPLGLNVVALLHVLLGGVGMTRLLRTEGLPGSAALFGGLAFEMMPKLAAHFGAGHLTLIYALTWTPWLISTWKRDSEKEPRRLGIGTAWIFALICLADVRWAMYAAVAWIAYGFAHSHETRRTISRLVLCLTLALLLASPLLLPFIEYTSQSTRWSMTVEDNLAFSLPPERLLGLVFPDLGGYHEWILYTGAIVLSLAVVALCGRANQRETRFWIALGIVALLFSLGSSLPLAEVIARLPGFNLLRVPSRALFLFEMASAVLAAYGFHFVLAGQVKVRFAGLSLAGYAIFAVLLTAGVSMLSGSLPVNFAWGAGVVAFSVLLVSWGLRGLAQKYRAVWMTALFGLLICDLGFVGRSLFVFHPVEQVLAAGEAAGAWLRAQSGVFRVYSPSYSLPQQTAARYNLRLADGVDPLQLERYANFMEKATGVPRHGYSVTLPPLKNGDPHTTNKTYLPDAALLGILNVRYVVADFDLAADGLALRQTFGETRVYENIHFLPPLWIQPVDVLPGEQAQPVSPFERSSNRIAAPVEGPGLLVLSEIIYPGWRVTVDEEEAVLVSVAGILRGVKLDAGRHAVEFVFRPTSLYIGLALCALGVLLSLLLRQKKGAGE